MVTSRPISENNFFEKNCIADSHPCMCQATILHNKHRYTNTFLCSICSQLCRKLLLSIHQTNYSLILNRITLCNINSLAIIQGHQEWEKLKQNGWQSAILNFIFSKIVSCCPCVTPGILIYFTASAINQDYPCVSPYILFHIGGPATLFCIVFALRK